jgi:hypothetical protein
MQPVGGMAGAQRSISRDALLRQAMTTAEIGAVVLTAEGIEASKADAQAVALGIQHSLKNHEGKGVERAGDSSPARWRLKEAAN